MKSLVSISLYQMKRFVFHTYKIVFIRFAHQSMKKCDLNINMVCLHDHKNIKIYDTTTIFFPLQTLRKFPTRDFKTHFFTCQSMFIACFLGWSFIVIQYKIRSFRACLLHDMLVSNTFVVYVIDEILDILDIRDIQRERSVIFETKSKWFCTLNIFLIALLYFIPQLLSNIHPCLCKSLYIPNDFQDDPHFTIDFQNNSFLIMRKTSDFF